LLLILPVFACFGHQAAGQVFPVQFGQDPFMQEHAGPPCQDRATFRRHNDVVTSVALAPGGRLMASGAGSQNHPGEIKLWDLDTLSEQFTLRGHTRAVLALAFSSDGQVLASAGADGLVKLWNPKTGQELATLKGHTGRVFALAFAAAAT